MIIITKDNLNTTIIHKVGNKNNDEDVLLSKNTLKLSDDDSELLIKYFITPFRTNELFNFFHEEGLENNTMYSLVEKMFASKDDFVKLSGDIANWLYNCSEHPKIKRGELYIVYFKDCVLDDEQADAIGIFKSESKDVFLKIVDADGSLSVESTEGISLNKLDKGCIIYNTEKTNGYLVAITDNSAKGSEAVYWKDDFLKVKQRQDNYFHTKNVIKLCKDFVTEKMPEEFNVTKADQADILNKSAAFFKEKEAFTMDDFKKEVIAQPEIAKSFSNYKKTYEEENDIIIADDFDISENAVKKQGKVLKNVIKLDKNFHIYVHGKREYIVKGYDEETGLHFYQLYYKQEN